MASEQTICLDAFLKEVKQELSVSCQIPINISNKEILRIINRAKQWFYKHYEDSVEEKYFIIHSSMWSTPTFLETRTVELPSNIFSVHGVSEVDKESMGALGWGPDPDFALDKFIFSDAYSSAYASADRLMYYVIEQSHWDLARQLLVPKISYTYNRLTHNLRFMGETPKKEVVLQVYVTIDDCSLFSDEIFYRWIVAQSKMQISRVLGTFSYNLPGNIQINYDLIRDEGREDIESIKEELKSEEGTDYFLTS